MRRRYFYRMRRRADRIIGENMDVDIIFRIAAIGIIVAVVNQILSKSGREEYTMVVTLAGLVIVLMMIIPDINELFRYIKSVFGL